VSDNSEVLDRLDRFITLVRIGFSDSIDRVRQEIAADPVATAILERTKGDWVASGELQRSVSQSANVSSRTVLRSLIALTERGLLLSRGSGKSTSYYSSGVL
jgi:hypothetical protein